MTNGFPKDAAAGAGQAADGVKRAAAAGLDGVRQAAGTVSEAAAEWTEAAAEYVRANPVGSLLGALGAGFLIGWVFKNR